MKDANCMKQHFGHAGMDAHSATFLTGMRWRMRPKLIYTPAIPYPAPRVPRGFVGNASDGVHARHLDLIQSGQTPGVRNQGGGGAAPQARAPC